MTNKPDTVGLMRLSKNANELRLGLVRPTRILFSYGEAIALLDPGAHRGQILAKIDGRRTAASTWHFAEWARLVGSPGVQLASRGEFAIYLEDAINQATRDDREGA